MRLLVISNLFPPYVIGGYEQRCQEFVNALKGQGHQITVLTSFYGLDTPRIDGDVLRLLDNEWRPGFQKKNWRGKILQKHEDVRILEKVIADRKPERILAFSLNGLSLQFFSRITKLNITKVFEVCDDWILKYRNEINNILEQISSKVRQAPWLINRRIDLWKARNRIGVDWERFQAIKVSFISQFLKQKYIAAGLIFQNSVVIHNSVDVHRLPQSSFQLFNSHIRLLYLGQVMPHKGVHTAVEAVHLLKQRVKDRIIDFSIYGNSTNDNYLSKLKDFIKKNGLEGSVHLHGTISQKELPKIFDQSDIFIFPSEWDEPFAGTLLEGMSSGLPIVSTATGGSGEIARDRENCLVFEPGNSEDLCVKCLELIQNQKLAQQISTNARKCVVNRFSKEVLIPKSLEFYLS